MTREVQNRPSVGPRDRFVLLTNIPTPYRTTFFNTLAERFDRRAIDTHVVYCAETEPNRHWELDPAAQTHPYTILPGLHVTLGKAYVHFNPGVVGRIRSLAPRWLLIGGAWHLPTVLLANRTSTCPGAARILWTEGHADAVLNATGPIAHLRRRAFASYDAFASPNARSGDFALSEAQITRPVLPLPNTVDEEFFTPPASLDVSALRAGLGLDADARVIATVCQLEDRKSVVELARAYAAIDAGERRGSVLAMLGDGPRRPEVEAIARSVDGGEIRLLGHVPAETVRSWLWASDCFALATRNDPNPLSPIEASFAGLPLLLSTKAGNIDELLRDGETGWRLESVDEASLSSGLRRVLRTEAQQLREMGQHAQRNANGSFRRSAVADRFIDALLATFPA